MIKMKLTPEQAKIFESGNKIENNNGIFMNFPYWIRKILSPKEEDIDMYEVYARSEIPGIDSGYKRGGLQESKYLISKTDGSEMDPEAWYFVLRVDKDPHAKVAALTYANSVESDNPRLAKELIERVNSYNPDK